MQCIKALKHNRCPNFVTPRQQTLGVIHTLCHGQVDIRSRCNLLVHRVHSLIHEHSEHAINQALRQRRVARGFWNACAFPIIEISAL